MAKLRFTEEHHEDLGDCLFFHFPSYGEAPDSTIASTNDQDFDFEYWTHFIELDFNSIIEQAKEFHGKKSEPCAKCGFHVLAPKDYKAEVCCSGGMLENCGCGGWPINPVFCDECTKELFKG